MLWPSTRSRREWDGVVESHQPSSTLHGKSEQIDIRHLPRPMKVVRVHVTLLEQADGAGPELVVFGTRCSAQAVDGLGGGHQARILWLTDDADESVLGQGAGRPAVLDLPGDPLPSPPMVNVARIEQREEHVDVEKRSHHSPTSSRSLSINSLETAVPRAGSGSKP